MSENYTELQVLVLTIAPCITGFLSIIGSSIIIFKILADRNRNMAQLHKRILLYMSGFDIIQSISAGMSTFAAPGDAPVMYALGNTMSCNIQGALTQLGFAVPFYNCALSSTFLLRIRYNYSEVQLRKIEPLMHLIAIGWPLGSTIAAWIMTLFNFGGNRCWINSYPFRCNEEEGNECTRGHNAYLLRWILIGGWYVIFLIFIPCCMLATYLTVRNAERKWRRRLNDNLSRNMTDERMPSRERLFPIRFCKCVMFSSRESKSSRRKRRRSARFMRRERIIDESWLHAPMASRTKNTAIQAQLYSAAIFITLIWGLILRAYEQFHGKLPFWLVFMHTFFYPMQGFLNFFIYVRPRVVRIKRCNPRKSYFWVLKQVLYGHKQSGNHFG
mmetsp:Transcript_62425/g.73940  ORF Transcript_62425/g.73940 Transcript_62425/m.73940 type:complete len:386 (+) Transcript_62425:107-1264(+)